MIFAENRPWLVTRSRNRAGRARVFAAAQLRLRNRACFQAKSSGAALSSPPKRPEDTGLRPMGSRFSISSAGPRLPGRMRRAWGSQGRWRSGSLLFPGSGIAVLRGGGSDGGGLGDWGEAWEEGGFGTECNEFALYFAGDHSSPKTYGLNSEMSHGINSDGNKGAPKHFEVRRGKR